MHRGVEGAVVASGLAHTFLRPGVFMSNDLGWASEIRAAGMLGAAYPDAPMAPIAERDIAGVAVAALLDPEAVPATVEMTGPESLSTRDRVATIAAVTGRPVELEELQPDQARERITGALSADAADVILGHLAEAPAVADLLPAPGSALGRRAGHLPRVGR